MTIQVTTRGQDSKRQVSVTQVGSAQPEPQPYVALAALGRQLVSTSLN
jgi:hypothetical protein